MRFTAGLAMLTFVMSAAPASAQFPSLYVIEQSGQETRGKLVSWSSSVLVLRVDDAERRFNLADVSRVDLRGDSLKNGALIGVGVGLGVGVLMRGLADCPGDQNDGCPGSRAALVLTSTAIYAAIGAGIDALIPGRTPLWRSGSSQGPAGGLTFSVSPQNRSAFIGWTTK
jgi:hypothetical protein